jgi:hypothetical protein
MRVGTADALRAPARSTRRRADRRPGPYTSSRSWTGPARGWTSRCSRTAAGRAPPPSTSRPRRRRTRAGPRAPGRSPADGRRSRRPRNGGRPAPTRPTPRSDDVMRISGCYPSRPDQNRPDPSRRSGSCAERDGPARAPSPAAVERERGPPGAPRTSTRSNTACGQRAAAGDGGSRRHSRGSSSSHARAVRRRSAPRDSVARGLAASSASSRAIAARHAADVAVAAVAGCVAASRSRPDPGQRELVAYLTRRRARETRATTSAFRARARARRARGRPGRSPGRTGSAG